MAELEGINADVLVWARQKAGLTLEEAAKRASLSRGDRLARLEAGAAPTRAELKRLADAYRRPLITFYLDEPPVEAPRGQDFRALAPDTPPQTLALVDTIVRLCIARQALVRDALQQSDDSSRLTFVGSINREMEPIKAAAIICKRLGFDRNIFRGSNNYDNAFNYARDAANSIGIFVVLIGNLGSHHTNIDPNVFRGFALADPYAPFIAINDNDARAAWSFTLMHEVTHLFLGESGLSAYQSDTKLEAFCDQVSAAILLGDDALKDIENALDEENLESVVSDYASRLNISRKMIVYNLVRVGRIGRDEASQMFDQLDRERDQRKAEQQKVSSSGPSYYVVRRHRLGQHLVQTVKRLRDEGHLSDEKAARALGVKQSNFYRLIA